MDEKVSGEPPAGGLSKARAAVSDRRAAILERAEKVFLEKGYQAASMSQIAGLLGGSKGTLYNYFPGKEELFIACVTRHCAAIQEGMSSLIQEHKGLRETLSSIGRRYLELVYSDDTVGKFRMIVAEAVRAPELGRAFYEMGPRQGAELLALYLEDLRAEGVLDFDDSMRAARHFLSLCDSRFAKARYTNAMQALDLQEVAAEVECAVRVFLAAYGVQKPAP